MPRRPLLALAALMLTKTLPCYTFEKGIHFLTTKSDETNDSPVFRAGFYVHITTSLLVLVAGLPQFLPGLARRGPGLHRRLGKRRTEGKHRQPRHSPRRPAVRRPLGRAAKPPPCS